MKLPTLSTLLLLATHHEPASAALHVEDIDIPSDDNVLNTLNNDPFALRCDGKKGGLDAKVPSFLASIIQARALEHTTGPFAVLADPTESHHRVLPVTKIFRTSDEHIDFGPTRDFRNKACKPNADRSPADGFVALFSVEDHDGAHFETEETCVPIQKNRLILFEGGRYAHRTVIRNQHAGKNVMFIGPVQARTLLPVGEN
ncbi:hypothetical protein ACHAXS_001743, partial [Conticribra weissflogii]